MEGGGEGGKGRGGKRGGRGREGRGGEREGGRGEEGRGREGGEREGGWVGEWDGREGEREKREETVMFSGLTLGLVRSCSQYLLCFAADELAAVHRSGQQGLANSQEIRPAAEEDVDFPELQ